MSWAALVLAGAVLAQLPPLPDLQDAPPYQQGNGAAQTTQGDTGVYNNQGRGLDPLPGWTESKADPQVPPPGPNPTPPPMKSPPGNTQPTDSRGVPTSGSNLLDRLIFSQGLVDEKNSSQQAPPPAAANVYGSDRDATGTPHYNSAVTAPSTASHAGVQIPAFPRLTSQEMLKQALTVPPNSVVAGRDVTLLDVLGDVTDRAKRVAIAHAYWHLARKMGEYRFCWEESQQIQATRLASVDSNLLSPAQQMADRELTAAELALIQAQYHLAEVAGLDSSGQLPLPADSFHTATYSTHFEKIFANRSPIGRTRLLHRTLPLQYQVMTVRVEAIYAAQDAFQEVARSYQAGQVDAGDVLATLHEVTAQKRAWIAAIARYNDSIADYALAIAGPETTGRDLVSILIKLSDAKPRGTQEKRADLSTESTQTSADERGMASKPDVPTLAPSREEMAAQAAAERMRPRLTDSVEKAEPSPAQDTNAAAEPNVTPTVPTLAPPQEEMAADAAAERMPPRLTDSVEKAELSPAHDMNVAAEPNATPAVPTLAPPREEMAADVTSQGVPPVPVDSPEAADLSVAPAAANVPATEGAGPVADPAVKPAVADVPVADQTPSSPTSEERETSEREEAKASEPTLAQSEDVQEKPAETPLAEAPSDREVDRSVAEVSDPGPADRDVAGNETVSRPQKPRPTALTTQKLAVQTRPMVAVEEPAATAQERTVFRQPTPSAAGQVAWPQANLVGLPEAVQAKKLTAILHGDVSEICPDAEPVDLEACLDRVAGAKRRSVIEAYWEASLRVAEYQIYRGRVAFLAELGRAVTLGAVGTADARARLKAAQFDAKANLLEAESRLLDAQHELTKRCDRSLEGRWLVPKTLPHAGDYRLHLDAQPRGVAESWALKRLAAIIPALNRSLKDRAAAVIKADGLRTQALIAYQSRSVPFERVLSAVDLQATECLEFVNVLATYNQSYADYVTMVVPETLPEEQLVATLVVR